MKRFLTGIGFVVVMLLFAIIWHIRVCSKINDGKFREHISRIECSLHREELDLARYWLALDNGMTNAPNLDRETLVVYVREPKVLNCPSGGLYSVDPLSKKIICSIPNHITETNKLNSWLLEYPLDYRKEDTWLYECNESEIGTTLRMSGATIVLKNIYGLGHGGGTTWVSGLVTMFGGFGSGNTEVAEMYSNGVSVFKIANHMIQIRDHGSILEIDKRSFDLSRERPRILVETNGMMYVEP